MPTVVSGNTITVSAGDIIRSAMMEIGALAAGEQPQTEEYSWGMEKLQRLFDRYNARRPMIWNVTFLRVTPPANKQPVTIAANPQADIDVTDTIGMRPVEIINAALILSTGGVEVEIPIALVDDAWWAHQTIKSLSSTYPTSLYYSPDWPSPESGSSGTQVGFGNIYLWPIPNTVNDLRLEVRTTIAQLKNYNDVFSMPPAYWDAVVYPLAVSLCPSFERSASPELLELEKRSIKAIQSNNISSPRLSTDAPSTRGNSARPDFNFLDGLSR